MPDASIEAARGDVRDGPALDEPGSDARTALDAAGAVLDAAGLETGCGLVCSTNHVDPVCAGGACGGTCHAGFADCNGDRQRDGCETAIATDLLNCGGCGVVCPSPAHATPVCRAGVCGGTCGAGFADCNAQMSDGCETDTSADPAQCGACHRACSGNNVDPACTAGACTGTCKPGFADCNADKRSDGCETPVGGDVNNCGGCAVVCRGTAGRGCVNGACSPTCDDGIANQGESDADCGGPCRPCEVGRQCAADSSCKTHVCKSGRCAAIACPNGFGLEGPPPVSTGRSPSSVAVADLNGDGKLDLAIVDWLGNSVSVALGAGQGSFAAKVDYPTGDGPRAVAIGDLDGDGKPDMAVANYYANTVSVFINKGVAVFAPKVDYPIAVASQALAIADLDGDGKSDIVVAAQSLSVLLNAGNGTFGAAMNHSTVTGNVASAVAVGDMNGDGKPDLVTADFSVVAVWLNQGSGTFATPTLYYSNSNASGVALADLSGDGKLDVAVSNPVSGDNLASDNVGVFLNAGDGKLGAEVRYTVGWHPRGIVAFDMNGDGRPDLAVPNYGTENVSVLVNKGAGVFATHVDYLVGSGPYAIATGDFNADGKADLAVANQGGDSVTVMLNRGGASFDARTDYPTAVSPASIAFGDIDGDGLLDLVAVNSTDANNSSNTVSVLRNSGNGSFAVAKNYPTGKRPTSVALGDLNGDGRLDLATANLTDHGVSVLLNMGSGTFAPHVDYPVGSAAFTVVASDLDGDGKVDLAVSCVAGLALLVNKGAGTFPNKVDLATNQSGTQGTITDLAVGDLDGDGRPDLARLEMVAIFGGELPAVVTLHNKGGGAFGEPQITYTNGRSSSVVIGDLRGSGRNGVVVGNLSGSVTAGGVDYPTIGTPFGLAVGDVNGDGRPDILVGTNRPAINVMLGSGSGTFAAAVAYTTSGGVLAAADLDSDGRLDLATATGTGLSVIPNLCLP
jgi:hypothetical protein